MISQDLLKSKGFSMKKGIKLSLVAGALVASASLFVGCGSSSSSTASTAGVGGVVAKGYLSGATVWLDINGNGQRDAGETTTTDANGNYSFGNTPVDGNQSVVVTGGIDTGSGDAFQGTLQAPYEAGNTVVNVTPITTIVSGFIKKGKTPAQAKAATAAAFGIAESDLSVDPVANVQSASGDANLTKKAIKVARLVEFVAAKSTGGVAANYDTIVSSIVDTLEANSSASIDQAVTTVVTNSNLAPGDKTAAANLATAIQDMNITVGATATQVKAVETATKLAVKILENNNTATLGMNNLTTVATQLVAVTEANASKVIDLNNTALLTSLSDSNASDFNASSTPITTAITSAETNATAYEEAQKAAAAQAIIDAAKAIDKLKITSNQVTVGTGSQAVTATLSSTGKFSDITHAVVALNDLGSLYSFSFGLENLTDENNNSYNSLENGDDKNVTVALKIVDNNSANKKLLAVIDHVSLTRGGTTGSYDGQYTVAVNSNTKLSAWGVKADGTKISTTNVALNTNTVTSSSSTVTASIASIVTQLENDATFGNSIANIKNLMTQNGSYTVSAYISGVDGVVSTAVSSASDVYTGFADYNSTISSKFSGTISKMSGTVSIGLTTAEVKANNTTSVATAKSALSVSVTNLTSNVTLPTTGSDGTTISWATSDANVISAGGVITRTETTGSATLTATISKGSGDTLASDTKTFSVTVTANPVSATNSSLAASSSSATFGGSAITLTATAKNETNSTVTGKTVTFSGAGTLGDLNASTCTTDSSGVCSVSYTPKSTGTDGNETVTASVTSNGNSVTLGTATISLLNDPTPNTILSSVTSAQTAIKGVSLQNSNWATSTNMTLKASVDPATGSMPGTTYKVNFVDSIASTTKFIQLVLDPSKYPIGTKLLFTFSDDGTSYTSGTVTVSTDASSANGQVVQVQ